MNKSVLSSVQEIQEALTDILCSTGNTTETKFEVGQTVAKLVGRTFTGKVRAVFKTEDDVVWYVVEHNQLKHMFEVFNGLELIAVGVINKQVPKQKPGKKGCRLCNGRGLLHNKEAQDEPCECTFRN